MHPVKLLKLDLQGFSRTLTISMESLYLFFIQDVGFYKLFIKNSDNKYTGRGQLLDETLLIKQFYITGKRGHKFYSTE